MSNFWEEGNLKSSTNFRNIRRGRRGRGRSRNKGIWRKDFNPWSGGRGKGWNQVTGVFNKIRRSLRRVKWKYARSVEGFCGRKRSFPVCKMGVRLDNDGIHPPTLPPERGGGDRGEDRWGERGESERGWWEKSLFSLPRSLPPSLPLFISFHSPVYRNQGGARWITEFRYRGRFFPGWTGRRKFSARPTNILSIDLRKILDFHVYIYWYMHAAVFEIDLEWLGLSWSTNLLGEF